MVWGRPCRRQDAGECRAGKIAGGRAGLALAVLAGLTAACQRVEVVAPSTVGTASATSQRMVSSVVDWQAQATATARQLKARLGDRLTVAALAANPSIEGTPFAEAFRPMLVDALTREGVAVVPAGYPALTITFDAQVVRQTGSGPRPAVAVAADEWPFVAGHADTELMVAVTAVERGASVASEVGRFYVSSEDGLLYRAASPWRFRNIVQVTRQ